MLDAFLSTLKNIFLYKNKMLLSALFNAIATGFYMLMIVKLSKTDNLFGILLICLATFVGTYISILLADHIEKDSVWIFDVVPPSNEDGKVFADIIRQENLAILTYKGYNNKEQVLCSKVFSQDREQSKLIESLIPTDFKYTVVELKDSKII